MIQCPICHKTFDAPVDECDNCGHVPPIAAAVEVSISAPVITLGETTENQEDGGPASG